MGGGRVGGGQGWGEARGEGCPWLQLRRGGWGRKWGAGGDGLQLHVQRWGASSPPALLPSALHCTLPSSFLHPAGAGLLRGDGGCRPSGRGPRGRPLATAGRQAGGCGATALGCRKPPACRGVGRIWIRFFHPRIRILHPLLLGSGRARPPPRPQQPAPPCADGGHVGGRLLPGLPPWGPHGAVPGLRGGGRLPTHAGTCGGRGGVPRCRGWCRHVEAGFGVQPPLYVCLSAPLKGLSLQRAESRHVLQACTAYMCSRTGKQKT